MVEKLGLNYIIEEYDKKRLSYYMKKFNSNQTDFLLFVDFTDQETQGNCEYKTTLIVKKVENVDKSKNLIKERLAFLCEENYKFGDLEYIAKSTNSKKTLNREGRNTLLLSLKYKQEEITKVYSEILSKLENFDLVVYGLKPEENVYVNKDHYEDCKIDCFIQFVNFYEGQRSDKNFSAIILDKNQNLLYNREIQFESEEEIQLRNFLISNLKTKPDETKLFKKVKHCKNWYNLSNVEINNKAVLFQINEDYSLSVVESFNSLIFD